MAQREALKLVEGLRTDERERHLVGLVEAPMEAEQRVACRVVAIVQRASVARAELGVRVVRVRT